ncbi:A/G-specific adenine glycosylase [Rubrimonas cliftonensis]|uniref:A/G-specific adenine glycosylase n=1 Tax=Rubrimonas cliftonensis TaxID=89524 RepID=UPI001FE23B79|nr:A/G-specific adenine glycosylase [Rubrimonas cliftonensis]
MNAAAPEAAWAAALLDWYDRHARRLPWRTGPAERAAGARPDPYRVWLSEIMLQQTTVATVGPYFARFIERWPTVEALAAAPREDVLAAWAGLGYYARARNLHACAQAAAARGGFPQDEAGLRELPGVGAYTAAAVAAIAFDAPAAVVDGNVERVVTRMFRIETPLPDAKPLVRVEVQRLTPRRRPGDFAQAMMDLGATICTPRRPACALCPWRAPCAARAAGVAESLPRKKPKAAKPHRLGVAFVAQRPDGAVLVETRPDRGLLGGMAGPPCTDWTDAPPDAAAVAAAAPIEAEWRAAAAEARHVFTHFTLSLEVLTARVGQGARPARGGFVPAEQARAAAPTALRKALDIGLAALRDVSALG